MQNQRRTHSQESEDTRSSILRAAEQIFAEKGYTGARVAEIAEKTGMDKKLIFYYFGTKHGLYAFILEDFFKRAEPLFDEFVSKRKANTRPIDLDRLMENMTDFIQRNRNPVRILFREFLDGGHLLEEMMKDRILPIFQLWRSYYPLLFPGTESSTREADHMLLTLSGMSLFYFLVHPLTERVWQEDPLHPDRLSERKEFLKYWVKGLIRSKD